MQAQSLLIELHDESAGYEITPDRVPLAVLRGFAKDVDEFLRGAGSVIDTGALDIAVVRGSLGLRTAPTADPALWIDLRHLAASEQLDAVDAKRRAVVERWQKAARGPHRTQVRISAESLPGPILVSAESDFRADDADQWVRVERYVRGEIEDMGGHTRPNAHVRLPDGKIMLVDAARELLRDEKTNRLYKPAMLRITADYNVATRDYRNARLIEFVAHDRRFDPKELERLTRRGAEAWRDVPDAGAWVDALRGTGD